MKPGSWTANVYRGVRRGTALRALLGQEPFFWTHAAPDILEFGSKYGRWAIRTTGLSAHTTLLCFGLGEDITFEQALIGHCGCRVVGFDPTPRSVAHLAAQQLPAQLSTHALALADHEGCLQLQLPPADAADQVSASAVAGYDGQGDTQAPGTAHPWVEVPCTTLEGALRIAGLPSADIVKMDVEGMEYRVIDQALASGWLQTVSQLLVEFHHFLPGLQARQTRRAIADLQAAGFRIAWVGRTNHEYLFVRG